MNSKLIIVSSLAACAGVCLYLYYSEYFIVLLPQHTQIIAESKAHQTRRTPVFFVRNKTWSQEIKDVLWTHNEPVVEHLLQQLLDVLYEEKYIQQRVRVEFAVRNASGSTLYIQLSQSPLDQGSIAANIEIVHSILSTLAHNNVQVTGVQFLVNSEPLPDTHLDFSSPWQLAAISNT